MSESFQRCVGLVQLRMSSDSAVNLARTISGIEQAAGQGARIICLPELFLSPYFCQVEDVRCFDLAEPVPGPTVTTLAAVARRLEVVLIVPVFERRAPGLYHNSAAVLDADGTLLGVYRKMHIPDDPGYFEKFYFTPGDLGFPVFTTRYGCIAVLICWDQWFPEAARMVALRGAEIIFYPTAIGWHPCEKAGNGIAQRNAWQTIQRAHAISNGVYVAAVNRVGWEPDPAGGEGLDFWGSSFICDPQGVVLTEAGTAEEKNFVAATPAAQLEGIRRNWPFLRDRRIDAYAGLEQRWLTQS